MLQGTLDVFSLDEVLGLLSGAKKTGVLKISGDRGSGSLNLRSGALVAGSAELASGDNGISDAIFELLRFESGSFVFDASDDVAGSDSEQLSIVLEAAHVRLGEWKAIEAVVPSMHHLVMLAGDLGVPQVTIDAAEWGAIVMVGEGKTVGAISGRLGLGEVDGSRRIKDLVERGLVSLVAPDFAPASELPSRSSAMPAAPPIPALPTFDDEASLVDASGVIDDSAPVLMNAMPESLPTRRASDVEAEIAAFESVMPDDDEVVAFESESESVVEVEVGEDDGENGSLLMRYLKSNG